MKAVYLAIFVDGDNGFENENASFVSESYAYANAVKLFEYEIDAINYLKDKIVKHYKNAKDAEDEINDLLKNLNKNGFYRDAENDAYILLTKTIH